MIQDEIDKINSRFWKLPVTKVKGRVGPGEVQALRLPPPKSHKGQNGKLLIIGGSALFHGAPLLAAKTASRICDYVFFASTPENNQLVKKLKSRLSTFIAVPQKELSTYIGQADCILIGTGLGATEKTKKLTESLLRKYPAKKWVIDADSLKIADPKFLPKNCVVTPHKKEFEMLFDCPPSTENVIKMAKKFWAIIVLKGKVDVICTPTECKFNYTGNSGMTKGGTGDVIAGMLAGFACKNDLFLSSCAATFINGLAGDRLFERVSYFFNAEDLSEEVPPTLKWCLDF